MLAVRLNEALEQELTSFSKRHTKTKTDVVKEALELYFKTQQEQNKKSAYELGKTFFGVHDSGLEDLSTTYKKRLKEKLSEKYNLNR
ncbi:MAG TPA: CopG family transcriptional regulator [Campylobacterales bacterium]|nr:CopG family transcriptional regulator [Campylobacterales bacterium]